MHSEKPKQKRQRFTKEFQASAVALVLDKGRSATSVANSLGLKPNSVHRWVQQARAERGQPEIQQTAEYMSRRKISCLSNIVRRPFKAPFLSRFPERPV